MPISLNNPSIFTYEPTVHIGSDGHDHCCTLKSCVSHTFFLLGCVGKNSHSRFVLGQVHLSSPPAQEQQHQLQNNSSCHQPQHKAWQCGHATRAARSARTRKRCSTSSRAISPHGISCPATSRTTATPWTMTSMQNSLRELLLRCVPCVPVVAHICTPITKNA